MEQNKAVDSTELQSAILSELNKEYEKKHDDIVTEMESKGFSISPALASRPEFLKVIEQVSKTSQLDNDDESINSVTQATSNKLTLSSMYGKLGSNMTYPKLSRQQRREMKREERRQSKKYRKELEKQIQQREQEQHLAKTIIYPDGIVRDIGRTGQ